MRSILQVAALAAVLILVPPVAAGADAAGSRVALVNARVWTGDAKAPWADALIVAGDTIERVGTDAEIRASAGDARIADLGGRMVVPGFIDSHVHFIDGGFRLASVQLRDAASKEVFVSRIAAHAKTLPGGELRCASRT